MPQTKEQMRFTCHTPNMLKEALNSNPTMAIFAQPFQIFANILHDVATRAAQLNDPILNDLMCSLTLFSIADPESQEYNYEAIKKIKHIAAEYKIKNNIQLIN